MGTLLVVEESSLQLRPGGGVIYTIVCCILVRWCVGAFVLGVGFPPVSYRVYRCRGEGKKERDVAELSYKRGRCIPVD